jgi:hypothetical protein
MANIIIMAKIKNNISAAKDRAIDPIMALTAALINAIPYEASDSPSNVFHLAL